MNEMKDFVRALFHPEPLPSPEIEINPPDPIEVTRSKLAQKHGLTEEHVELFLMATDDVEELTMLAERLSGYEEPPTPPRGSYVPCEGKNPRPNPPSSLTEFTRDLFNSHPYTR